MKAFSYGSILLLLGCLPDESEDPADGDAADTADNVLNLSTDQGELHHDKVEDKESSAEDEKSAAPEDDKDETDSERQDSDALDVSETELQVYMRALVKRLRRYRLGMRRGLVAFREKLEKLRKRHLGMVKTYERKRIALGLDSLFSKLPCRHAPPGRMLRVVFLKKLKEALTRQDAAFRTAKKLFSRLSGATLQRNLSLREIQVLAQELSQSRKRRLVFLERRRKSRAKLVKQKKEAERQKQQKSRGHDQVGGGQKEEIRQIPKKPKMSLALPKQEERDVTQLDEQQERPQKKLEKLFERLRKKRKEALELDGIKTAGEGAPQLLLNLEREPELPAEKERKRTRVDEHQKESQEQFEENLKDLQRQLGDEWEEAPEQSNGSAE